MVPIFEPGKVIVSRRSIQNEVGQTLRRARLARKMTLRDVGVASNGVFRPTAVAGYERAERNISLERFCGLARLYGMNPERLLSQIMWRAKGGAELTVDRNRIDALPPKERDAMNDFIKHVRRMRGVSDDGIIALRINDLEVLATVNGSRLEEFVDRLRPALVQEDVPS
ncbi:MAG TPA: helix-turn-helix transcriptional regulator [Actinomycetota bacterium]|nr:helix-turn-helix transcriptional regulator [Actinomycetota bacterium]